MADTLYLSLWYPNLRLAALAEKLTFVLSAFAAHGGESGVYAATVWPVSWSESPVFQRVWGRAVQGPERGIEPRQAVEETLELLHEDYAYEFQIGWSLWEMEAVRRAGGGRFAQGESATADPSAAPLVKGAGGSTQDESALASLDARWVRTPRLVRVTGYGPLFDEGAYEQDGHIRIDFGDDTAFIGAPFVEEGAPLDAQTARHVEENIRQLIALTRAVEKESGATARLLWSELGESLAQRLAARLGVGN